MLGVIIPHLSLVNMPIIFVNSIALVVANQSAIVFFFHFE